MAGASKDHAFRDAVPADAAELLAYLRSVGGESDNLSFGPEGLGLTVEEEAAAIARHTAPPSCMVVAVADGRIVACGTVGVPASPRMGRVGTLGLSVLREHWGRGIGRNLLAELVRKSAGAGLERLSLSVQEDNARARGLYEAAGFAYEGRLPAAVALGEERHDLLLMGRPLP